MKKVYIILFIFITYTFSNDNLSSLNTVKKLIQKEEFIALAINKYIIENRQIPEIKNNENTSSILNWDVLLNDRYLGKSFNKENPLTKKSIIVKFNEDKEAYIYGILAENKNYYKEENRFLYNLYTNRIFRVNTQSPISSNKEFLLKGSLVLYSNTASKIVEIIKEKKEIRLDSEKCPKSNYFYELKNNKFTYKYCKSNEESIEVYQTSPIYVNDINDLKVIKAKIGDKAYAKEGGLFKEYYYQGDAQISWIPTSSGSILTKQNEDLEAEDRIISYIPDQKDIFIRSNGGCMLANGDIFCWGENSYKKTGVSNYGQLNKKAIPHHINTPVMLKVQIDNQKKINNKSRRDKKWYNNPYRIKFEKISMNETNVCGISPIFDYFDSGETKKFGGDLYCNGKISSSHFEDLSDTLYFNTSSSILKKHKFFAKGKIDLKENSNEIYLVDIAMTDGQIVVLSDNGELYKIQENSWGYINYEPVKIEVADTFFKAIYSLRDSKTFAALSTNNKLYIWGERLKADGLEIIINEPTKISNLSIQDENIYVNNKNFVFKSNNEFFKTKDELSYEKLKNLVLEDHRELIDNARAIAIFEANNSFRYLFIDEYRQLKGSPSLLSCKNRNNNNCSLNNQSNFNNALEKLNTYKFTIKDKKYANLANIGIFQSNQIIRYDDFERKSKDWYIKNSLDENFIFNTGKQAGKVLGRFGKNSNSINANGEQEIYKLYDFGLTNGNKEVEISFDFYEIDRWDGDAGSINDQFKIFINNNLYETTIFWDDEIFQNAKEKDGFVFNYNFQNTQENYKEELHKYKFIVKLNSFGQVKLGFGANLNEDISFESFAIDNIKIKVIEKEENKKPFMCLMEGISNLSQMYCWGEVNRSIPILNSSLYDMDEIIYVNKLFISEEEDLLKQQSFDKFNGNNNTLFLMYPNYISGFDYEFYFK